MRRIDEKLGKITGGNYDKRDFIVTFSKDADLTCGRSAPGKDVKGRLRPLNAYVDEIRRVIDSDIADIVLTSLSTAELLSDRAAWGRSNVTPAVRLNDPTNIWRVRGGAYAEQTPLPYRSSRLDAVKPTANLGLYSISFRNDAATDQATLRAYCDFRDLAVAVGIRHFLQLDDRAGGIDTGDTDTAEFLCDMLVRSLAGVARRERPVFVMTDYFGPAAMEELAGWDPSRLVVGISGCIGGTTRDCLERLAQAERHGARLTGFSREAFECEDPVLMLQAMRRVIREGMTSFDAVKAYHADLKSAGVTAFRALQDDVELTKPLLKRNERRAA